MKNKNKSSRLGSIGGGIGRNVLNNRKLYIAMGIAGAFSMQETVSAQNNDRNSSAYSLNVSATANYKKMLEFRNKKIAKLSNPNDTDFDANEYYVKVEERRFYRNLENNEFGLKDKLNDIKAILKSKFKIDIDNDDTDVDIIRMALIQLAQEDNLGGLGDYTDEISSEFDMNLIDAYGCFQAMFPEICTDIDGVIVPNWSLDDSTLDRIISFLKYGNFTTYEYNSNKQNKKVDVPKKNIDGGNNGGGSFEFNLNSNQKQNNTKKPKENAKKINTDNIDQGRNKGKEFLFDFDKVNVTPVVVKNPETEKKVDVKPIVVKEPENEKKVDVKPIVVEEPEDEKKVDVMNDENIPADVKEAYMKIQTNTIKNYNKPYTIISKSNFKIYMFDKNHKMLQDTSGKVLLGSEKGDHQNIKEDVRTTPGGKYYVGLKINNEKSSRNYGAVYISLVPMEGQYDYSEDYTIGIHAIYIKEFNKRLKALKSETTNDNNISYGCPNTDKKTLYMLDKHLLAAKKTGVELEEKDLGSLVYITHEP